MINRRVLVPVSLLVAAALACSPSLPGNTALYKDNFSDTGSGWCVSSSKSSQLDYAGGEYVFHVKDPNWFVWCPYEQSSSDVHVEVTAKNAGNTADTTFGVICNDQKTATSTNEDLYFLGYSSDGYYNISLQKNGNLQTLAKGTNKDIATEAFSYTIGADCAGGNLALYVNGAQIASAHDTTYTSGDVGLFVWTGDKTPAEIHYDDFVVTKLSAATATPKP